MRRKSQRNCVFSDFNSPENLNSIKMRNRTLKNRMLVCKQMLPVSGRNCQPLPAPKERQITTKPHEKAFVSIYKHFNIYKGASVGENNFWRSLLPQILKEKKKLKNIWIKERDNIPKFTRGFKGNTGDSLDFSVKELGKTPPENKPLERVRQEKKTAVPKRVKEPKPQNKTYLSIKDITDQVNGTSEQQIYTTLTQLEGIRSMEIGRGVKRKGLEEKTIHKNKNELSEPAKVEMPLPRRCRLSCSLPPAEFMPSEAKEFLPPYSKRFTSRPAQTISSENSASTIAELGKTKKKNSPNLKQKSVKTISRTSTKKIKSPVKSKKVYPLSLKFPAPQILPSPEVVPKMRALLFEPDSLALNYYTVNAPNKIFKDEVLVQVIYSGVCGTDLSITEGKMSCGNVPVILGHEISGKVYAAGSDVTHVKVGDSVAINPYTACSTCRYCVRGFLSSCVNEGLNNGIGMSKNGGWAEYVVVKKAQIHKIPLELGLDQAAVIQPLSCILSAMSKLNISDGLKVYIQGLGLAGCLWASVLHSQGNKNVFVSDRNEIKKENFVSLNLGYPLVAPEDLEQHNADVIIECTGSPMFTEKSLKILNPNGQMCFFGKPNPLTEIRCMPYEIIRKEIKLLGNMGNSFCFAKAIDLAMSMGYRYLDFDKLGVKVFDLKDFQEAFNMKRSGEVSKVMFKFEN